MSDPSPFRAAQAALLWTYARVGRALRRTPVGLWLFETAYVAYKIGLEARTIRHLAPRIRPGTWAIDVGANIGVFTLVFAREVSGSGGVLAIEPEAENLAILRRRLDRSGLAPRVHVYAGVAADETGTLHLKVNPLHPGDHRLSAEGIAVASTTLDALVETRACETVSLIKIDVQGAELRVLRGARATLQRDRPDLFLEIDHEALREQNCSAGEIVQWLSALGYSAYRLGRDGAEQPVGLDQIAAMPGYFDVLFRADRGAKLPRPDLSATGSQT